MGVVVGRDLCMDSCVRENMFGISCSIANCRKTSALVKCPLLWYHGCHMRESVVFQALTCLRVGTWMEGPPSTTALGA